MTMSFGSKQTNALLFCTAGILILASIQCQASGDNFEAFLGKPILLSKELNPADCEYEGDFPLESDCTKYFQCLYVRANTFIYHLYQCESGRYFNTTVLGCMQGSCSISTTTTTPSPSSSTTTTRITTTTTRRPGFQCTSEGYFADPENCMKYYQCRFNANGDGFLVTHNTCPPRLRWDQPELACVTGTCGYSYSY